MRITQLVLLAAAMLWTTMGLPTAAAADQTAGASAKHSVEKSASYDAVLELEGLFRHRHARLMRLHQLAMEHGRLARAGEIERLMEHLGEGHVKLLHERRAQMNELQKAHVDELLSDTVRLASVRQSAERKRRNATSSVDRSNERLMSSGETKQ